MSGEQKIDMAYEIERLGDPSRHSFDTNGFPVETCRNCGYPESSHLRRSEDTL